MPFSSTWSYCFSPSTIVNKGAPLASFLDGYSLSHTHAIAHANQCEQRCVRGRVRGGGVWQAHQGCATCGLYQKATAPSARLRIKK